MSRLSDHEALAAFMSSMEAEGISPAYPIAQDLLSGRLQRFECVGDGRGRRNGFAVLKLGRNPSGFFGNWRMGKFVRWYASSRRKLSQHGGPKPAQLLRPDKIIRQEQAARKAAALWTKCRPADPAHPYLVRKAIQPECIGQLGKNLVVPMIDIEGNILNLQFITPDGDKRFLTGGRVTGLFWVRPGPSQAGACIGEGVGTMAAIAEATDRTVVAAFSASNLLPVAKAIAERYPNLDITICADNDQHRAKNVGLEAAKKAAAAIGAWLAWAERTASDD
jgi:putative DNA primase/helicase